MADHSDPSSELPAAPSRARSRRFAVVDFLALVVVLGVLNALISRGDPGWFTLNPTPWLVVPAVLGVRYGFAAGVLSGLATAGLLLGARIWWQPAESFADHKFLYASLPLFGV